MKIEIELTEAEIKEAVLGIIANDYAKRLDAEEALSSMSRARR